MHKAWLVARHEYLRITRKRSYRLGMLAVPGFFAVLILVGVLIGGSLGDIDELGYVDEAGFLPRSAPTADDAGPVPLILPDEEAGRAALLRGDIEAFYVFPADYLDTRAVTIYYTADPPSSDLQMRFDEFVRDAAVASASPAERTRLQEGFSVTLETPNGETMDTGGLVGLIIPGAMAMLFMFTVLTTGGYLMLAISDERENRTVEVLTTSLSPEQLIIGKAAGLISAAFTQLVVWSATTAVALIVASRYIDVFAQIELPLDLMVVAVLFFIPSFILVSGVMTLVGSVISDTRQGQQLSAIVNIFFVLPLFFLTFLLESPDSAVSVILTLFPTTSMMTVAMRWAVTTIPVWQLILAYALLLGAAAAAMWAAPRVFRAGMLRYGQRLAPRHVVAALRTGGR